MMAQKRCQVTKPIIDVKIYYKLLYVIQVYVSNFLASTDIKVLGHTYTYIFTMLLLIGLALFLHPGCMFLFSIHTLLFRLVYCCYSDLCNNNYDITVISLLLASYTSTNNNDIT